MCGENYQLLIIVTVYVEPQEENGELSGQRKSQVSCSLYEVLQIKAIFLRSCRHLMMQLGIFWGFQNDLCAV